MEDARALISVEEGEGLAAECESGSSATIAVVDASRPRVETSIIEAAVGAVRLTDDQQRVRQRVHRRRDIAHRYSLYNSGWPAESVGDRERGGVAPEVGEGTGDTLTGGSDAIAE